MTRRAATIALCLLALPGCGGGDDERSGPDATSGTVQAPGERPRAAAASGDAAGAPSAAAVERALLTGVTPRSDRPRRAECRQASAVERRRSGFGEHTRLPILSCRLAVHDELGTYAVEVVPNGCFVAEQLGRPHAIFGCGVAMTRRLRFARQPYLGVACRTANSIACDRVGLAVWLRRKAFQVTATIAGRRFVLDEVIPPRAGSRSLWTYSGFLQPAGLRQPGPLEVTVDRPPTYWAGAHPVSAVVRVEAVFGDGGDAAATRRVLLRPG